MGLYYNRGSGTAANAVKYLAQGMPLSQALNQACLDWAGRNGKPNYLCTQKGFGAYYYDRVQERCVQLYGNPCSTNIV